VELLSRNNKDFSARFPEIVEAIQNLPVTRAILDGEITALDQKGRSSFQLLQGLELQKQRAPLAYYLFDLLQEEDEDLRGAPLHERKKRLEALLKAAPEPLRFSPGLNAPPAQLLKKTKKMGLEGLIGKQADSHYETGRRSGAWIKLKSVLEQEFVIGGFTPPEGSRQHFGALLVGHYDKRKLVYCGKVGTGFNHALLQSLYKAMDKLRATNCPFSGLPESEEAGRWHQKITPAEFRKCHWIKPKLVAQIKFAEWTEDGKLRQPVFLGLREDKDATEVKRETPA
jgi:bifunctional non-homologous end joining protein LigD